MGYKAHSIDSLFEGTHQRQEDVVLVGALGIDTPPAPVKKKAAKKPKTKKRKTVKKRKPKARIGELLKALPKAKTGPKSKLSCTAATQPETKEAAVERLGFEKTQAHRFEVPPSIEHPGCYFPGCKNPRVQSKQKKRIEPLPYCTQHGLRNYDRQAAYRARAHWLKRREKEVPANITSRYWPVEG